jgi:hypothetical protein
VAPACTGAAPGGVVSSDPEVAARRAAYCQAHAAAMAAYWCLVGQDAGVVDAVNYAAIHGTGVDRLPAAGHSRACITGWDGDTVLAWSARTGRWRSRIRLPQRTLISGPSRTTR